MVSIRLGRSVDPGVDCSDNNVAAAGRQLNVVGIFVGQGLDVDCCELASSADGDRSVGDAHCCEQQAVARRVGDGDITRGGRLQIETVDLCSQADRAAGVDSQFVGGDRPGGLRNRACRGKRDVAGSGRGEAAENDVAGGAHDIKGPERDIVGVRATGRCDVRDRQVTEGRGCD